MPNGSSGGPGALAPGWPDISLESIDGIDLALDWMVPVTALSVPGGLLVLLTAVQIGGGGLLLPVNRQMLDGERRRRRRLLSGRR